jgi:bifunctional isochorismate lyase/aryl carrier protein
MSLPTRIVYDAPVPPRFVLPTSRAGWRLDVQRAAVLVHDMQVYFLRPYDPQCPALVGAIAATRRIVEAARGAGVPVFYTAQKGNQDLKERGLQADLWGAGMPDDVEQTGIIEELAPHEGESVLHKHRYSAFARNDFARQLAEAKRDQLIVTGVYAHIGITATALEAFQREVQPFLVADAVADFGEAQHRAALVQMADCCASVILAEEVVRVLDEWKGNAKAVDVDKRLRRLLAKAIGMEAAEIALADKERDLFHLGLNSIKAFTLLDQLADEGVGVEFTVFARTPTAGFLREAVRAAR